MLTRATGRTRFPWLFISPWLIGLLALFVFPFIASLILSFTQYDLLTSPRYTGWTHYRRVVAEFMSGRGAGKALWNTFYFAAVSVPLSTMLAIGLAVMLNWKVRGQAVFRTLFYLPTMMPLVASSILWLWLLDPRDGLVNGFLGLFMETPPLWFHGIQEGWLPGEWFQFGSKDGLVFMAVWSVGNFMLIYLAALGDISRDLYRASELDGAGRFRQFWHITLPMLSPVIFFNIVLGFIQSMQAFTQVYIVSEGTGQPAESTLMLSLHLFLSAFRDLEMGYASAMAWVLFGILALATWGLFRSSRKWVHYQGVHR
ncbi:MAG: sugar ABC transporter permease [Planctomycetota bacterium]|nr:sugar ABC transporter permease [Planctomycetota bacterium]